MTVVEFLVKSVGGWWWLLALIVLVLGVGRLTRVVTYDKYPPAMWLRQKWTDFVVKHHWEGWHTLFYCPWCMSPWIALVGIGWFFLTFLAAWLAWTWWIFWGWLAISYIVSMVIVRDEPVEPQSAPTGGEPL